MRRKAFALALAMLMIATPVWASQTTLDFETLTSLTQLPARWSIGGNSTVLSLQAGCQAPASMIGTSGTKGLQYSSSNGTVGYLSYALPASKASVSIGMAYKTGPSYPWAEGPHFLGFGSYSWGDLAIASDERNSNDNTREIRISRAENTDTGARITVADNTWYWVTMRWVAGQPAVMRVYDSSLLLVGSATWNVANNQSVDYVFIGNDQAESGEAFTTCLDNFMEADTPATYPLLPVPPDITAPSIPTGLTANAASSSEIDLSWTASTDPDNTVAQVSYNVFRNGTRVATTAAGVTTYSDTGLAASTTYNYTVSAVDPAKNNSAQSGSISATTPAPPPIGPGNYTTLGGYQSTVTAQSSDGTMWLGTVVVNGTSVPTFWDTNGASQNPVFSLR